MASPQTHGIITLFIWGILSVFGLVIKVTPWEFVSILFFGIGIDLDHLVSWSYLRDVPSRIKRGGGMPAKEAMISTCWLHLWPGLVLACLWVIISCCFDSSFRVYLPFVFWLVHLAVDYFEKNPSNPHLSFWYPFSQKKTFTKNGYPVKSPAEFIINSAIWMLIALVFLGIMIFK